MKYEVSFNKIPVFLSADYIENDLLIFEYFTDQVKKDINLREARL